MRAITFPKTSEGVWTNRETGVKIERRNPVGASGAYRAYRPADVSTGYIGICSTVGTLAEARYHAARYVRDSFRHTIAEAYIEAVAEDRLRVVDAAADASMAVVRENDHAEALEIEASRHAHLYGPAERVAGCTRAYNWLGEHVFEDDEIEYDSDGYDGFERCEKPADHPLHVEGAHAAAIREDQMRLKMAQGGPFYARVRLYRATHHVGIREGIQAVRDEDRAEALAIDRGYPSGQSRNWREQVYRRAVEMNAAAPDMGHAADALIDEAHEGAIDEDIDRWLAGGPECSKVCAEPRPLEDRRGHHTDCRRRAYMVAGPSGRDQLDGIYGARWPEDEGREPYVSEAWEMAHAEQAERDATQVLVTAEIAPEVPADLDDDAAWTAYCAALPEPTDQQIADVLAEYGDPYAAPRADAVEGFKNTARVLWKLRADAGHTALHVDVERNLRSAMRTFRGVIETYDMLTESWRLSNRTDAGRDSAIQTF
jgi:hypothetical protein